MEASSPYTFSQRLPESFPSQIVVDVTERCNLACAHCLHGDFVRHPSYAGRDMDEAIHDKLIHEAATDGKGALRYIRYTAMGEPLLHPRIFPFLEKAVRESGTAITLTTNGTLLDEDAAVRLLDTGIHLVDISLDAFSPAAYKAVRRGGNRERTYKNVLRLLSERARRGSATKIVTSFIEQPLNEGEGEPFKKFWLENGADDVVIRRLHSQAGGRDDIADTLKTAEEHLERRPCLYPWERLSVGSSGKISYCPACWAYQNDYTEFADFRTHSIKECWQGEFMRTLRAQHLANDFAGNSLCGACPDWAQTRWPHEGRSYADMVGEFMDATAEKPGSAHTSDEC